jgi:hypothetical protein
MRRNLLLRGSELETRGDLETDSDNMAFVRNSSASRLTLWKKRLARVPDSVWERTELETLVLADNELSEVSEPIGRLSLWQRKSAAERELRRSLSA